MTPFVIVIFFPFQLYSMSVSRDVEDMHVLLFRNVRYLQVVGGIMFIYIYKDCTPLLMGREPSQTAIDIFPWKCGFEQPYVHPSRTGEFYL